MEFHRKLKVIFRNKKTFVRYAQCTLKFQSSKLISIDYSKPIRLTSSV